MDSDEMYNSIKILDRWYADNYRNKTKWIFYYNLKFMRESGFRSFSLILL
jgi:hypothetical protein